MPQETSAGWKSPGIDESEVTSDHISLPAPDLKARQNAVASPVEESPGAGGFAGTRQLIGEQPMRTHTAGSSEPIQVQDRAVRRESVAARPRRVTPLMPHEERPFRESPAAVEAREWAVHNPAASVAVAAATGLLFGIAFRKSFSHQKRRY